MPHATCSAEGYNPLCGDTVHLYLNIEKGYIQEASFQGAGCAISTASASLMTELLIGKSILEIQTLFQQFQSMMTSEDVLSIDLEHLGKLSALSGVKAFPMRVKCATLAWHALNNALFNSTSPQKLNPRLEIIV
jgi:nitrogen fixation NifU-like protein